MRKAVYVLIAVLAGIASAAAATDDETKPFPSDPARMAGAEAFVGKSCSALLAPSSGFVPPKGALPVIEMDGVIRPLESHGARFAFLFQGNGPACKVSDVVALPDAAHANAFLQCASFEPTLSGFGMRLAGKKPVVGFWIIVGDKLMRQPSSKLGRDIRCREPESAE